METLIVKILFLTVAAVLYVIQILGIPANFAGPLIALIYLLTTDGTMGWGKFIIMLLLAVSGEVMDALMGLLGAKKYGASKKGMIAAGIGGFAGAIVGGMVVPVIGSVIGVFLGIFLFTFAVEYRLEAKDSTEAGRAGKGAVIGKLLALAYKYAAGLIILILLGFALFRQA
ncbi:MAG: DUF456 domain-containing protein [Spirochaetales bacterium]|nr:DUF456 domain-containing protein [Spirochaetales bacterium]